MSKPNIFKIAKKITKESESSEEYGTGLVGEKLIVSAYKQMPLDKLEKMRYIINKIIKKKKEFKRVEDAKNKQLQEKQTD